MLEYISNIVPVHAIVVISLYLLPKLSLLKMGISNLDYGITND